MKNLTSFLVVLCICFATTAGDWPYSRLERLYITNPTKCLRISKRYIKYLPDNAIPYYFASIVYRDKSQTHGEMKTRYMMMMKSIGYAMKFENFDEIDIEIKVGYESYIEELETDTDLLIGEIEQTELARFGGRLANKHRKLIDNRELILLVAGGGSDTHIIVPGSDEPEATALVETAADNSDSQESGMPGYFGLAT
ncbi:MAG: hypothetical protein HRT57_14510, partial [Crocinitomicaceae bacterium]|nr:hypothetical protein [Crocinitomicaceae bacterium]